MSIPLNLVMLLISCFFACQSKNILINDGIAKEADASADDGVDQPIVISSAFLYCAKDHLANRQKNTVGCRLEDENQKKLKVEKPSAEDLTAYGKDKKELPVTGAKSHNPYWHWLIAAGDENLDQIEIVPEISYSGLSRSAVKVQEVEASRELESYKHMMFYTIGTYEPFIDFFDLTEADSICANEAAQFFPDLNWQAVLNNNTEQPDYRVDISGAVVNTKGELITNTTGRDFWSVSFQNRVRHPDPFILADVLPLQVWTGLSPTGDQFNDCLNWTTNDPNRNGLVGNINSLDNWLFETVISCDSLAHLYCISM